jgi:hypothetical protein
MSIDLSAGLPPEVRGINRDVYTVLRAEERPEVRGEWRHVIFVRSPRGTELHYPRRAIERHFDPVPPRAQ